MRCFWTSSPSLGRPEMAGGGGAVHGGGGRGSGGLGFPRGRELGEREEERAGGASVAEHGARDTAAGRHAVHCCDRGEVVLQITPGKFKGYCKQVQSAFW